MEQRELQEIETALRDFADGHGLSWVVQEVDRDIAAGVTESKQLWKSARNNITTYSEIDGKSRGRQRHEEFLTQRPMTLEERTMLLLSAIERAVVSTRSIAGSTMEELRQREEIPYVAGVSFEPDPEFEQSTEGELDLIDFSRDPAAAKLESTLRSLRTEIES